eukprot:m.5909 g.5909  ORF g.5909 m.5909 type:complete len:58 (+) comp5102_c0_seq1:786-959(+)
MAILFLFVVAEVYCIGRVLYFTGYCSGDPKGRMRGAIQYVGKIGLLGMCIYGVASLW